LHSFYHSSSFSCFLLCCIFIFSWLWRACLFFFQWRDIVIFWLRIGWFAHPSLPQPLIILSVPFMCVCESIHSFRGLLCFSFLPRFLFCYPLPSRVLSVSSLLIFSPLPLLSWSHPTETHRPLSFATLLEPLVYSFRYFPFRPPPFPLPPHHFFPFDVLLFAKKDLPYESPLLPPFVPILSS